MTDNDVNPFGAEMAKRQQEAGARAAQAAAQHYGANPYPMHPVVQQQREVNGRQDGRPYLPYSQADALLGELLREVLELRQQLAGLQDGLQDMTEAMRERAEAAMPPNALRHGTPR